MQRSPRRLSSLVLLALFALPCLASACIKPLPPKKAPDPVPVKLAVVLESVDDAAVASAPAAVDAQIRDELVRRNLVVQDVEVTPAFGRIRSTEGRLALMEGEGVAVIVEAVARFSAQVNGRYRWSIEVAASVHDPDRAGPNRSFRVPVHLVYDHLGRTRRPRRGRARRRPPGRTAARRVARLRERRTLTLDRALWSRATAGP